MTSDASTAGRLEKRLATMLNAGTWLASIIIGVGLAAILLGTDGTTIVAAGVAVFLCLPVLRVILMLAAFLRARDAPFVAAATLVLAIIAISVAVGSLSRS